MYSIFIFIGVVHGHDCYLTEDINEKIWGKTTEERHDRTLKRQKYIEQQGYEVIVKWECEFMLDQESDDDLKQFLLRFHRPLDCRMYISEQSIIDAIRNDLFFGAAEVDIQVPKHLYEKFQEFSPIFINAEVGFNDIGAHMQSHVEENNLDRKGKRLLLGVMKAEKILLATPLLKWYLLQGLEITKVYQTIEFDLDNNPFHGFVNSVTNARREGDRDPNKSILALTSKLIGNSAFGSNLMRKQRHTDTCYSRDEKKINEMINNKRFIALTELDEGYCEINMKKKKILMNIPISIGFFILQYAKLRLLSFYFQFIDKYIDRSDFELVQCDTDSLYIAFSDADINKLIKPHMLDAYKADVNNWLPRSEPIELALFDQREPGLFKVEWEGDKVVALNSKMYSVYNANKNQTKFSCKGVSKKNFKHPTDMYKSVLETKQSKQGSNIGFRTKDSRVLTYTQTRNSFTYFYIKRKVLADGIHTTFLDIIPKPS